MLNIKQLFILSILHKRKYDELKSMENKYKGKRCFIIGNGPSLRMEDLIKIKDEYTFAFNGIIEIMEDYKWHPTFYMIQDYSVLKRYTFEELNFKNSLKFMSTQSYLKSGKKYHDYLLYNLNSIRYPNFTPSFSNKPYKFVSDGFTVTYSAIQMAIFFGFSDIFLIGLDTNYVNTDMESKDKNLINYPVFFKNKNKMPATKPNIQYNIKAYEKAKTVAIKEGVKIINASRGGKLDVFTREDFDTLL
jgi:hypothetical protein